jgi:ubiquinone/menaquinone biosynthesis C-methylase UbiE
VLRRLAARAVRPREAIGVDRAPGMLARAGGLPAGWTTIAADARHVPLRGGGTDVVTCAYLLHLLEPPARAAVLAEARRLLAPGPHARLVVVTVWSPRPLVRGALALLAGARPAACGGLRPLDPSADLVRAGFTLERRVTLPRHGYPSLVVRAEPAHRTC